MYHLARPLTLAAALVTFGTVNLPGPAHSVDLPLAEQALPLNPVAASIEALLTERGLLQSDVGRYYAAHNFMPVWYKSSIAPVAVLTAMAQADDHGLPEAEYNLSELSALVGNASTPVGKAAAEIGLSLTFVEFARDLNSGVVDPDTLSSDVQHNPVVMPVADILALALGSEDVDAVIATLMPQGEDYLYLLEERRRLHAVIAEGDFGSTIPTNRMMRPGFTGDRVALVRQRLRSLGYKGTAPIVAVDADEAAIAKAVRVYDADLVTLVKTFQSDHQLHQDGILGPATIGRLNASAPDRMEQILVNMERHRWLNMERTPRYIRVNIPDFNMAVIDNGVVTFTSRVVVGKSRYDHKTPEFSDEMTHLIVNPYWHVPKSIARKEYLPMLKQDPQALAKRGLQLLNSHGQVLNTAGADFSGYSQSYFPFYIKQPPGGGNALGRVKFMFPNGNNIYLHDTPSKSLFKRQQRAYSHGCVRVQKPFELAYHLLAAQYDDAEGVFHSLLKTGREKQVNLDTPIQVHLVYHTAFAGPDGAIIYRDDIYGRDKPVFEALLQAGVEIEGVSG